MQTRTVIIGIGVVMVAAAPITLVNPARIYDDLLEPSLAALWLSQHPPPSACPACGRLSSALRVDLKSGNSRPAGTRLKTVIKA
jgi:hypothetical protein